MSSPDAFTIWYWSPPLPCRRRALPEAFLDDVPRLVQDVFAVGTLPEDRWLAYRRLKAESAREELQRAQSTHRYRK